MTTDDDAGLPTPTPADEVPPAALAELSRAFGPARPQPEAPTAPVDDSTEAGVPPRPVVAPPTSTPASTTTTGTATRTGPRTVVIADDGLPDPVELDRHPFTTRDPDPDAPPGVVIDAVLDNEDDSSATALLDGHDLSPISAPRVDPHPRLRARRIAVRREAGRRRLRWFVVVGLVLAVVAAAVVVLATPLVLSVRNVRVDGAAYTDPELIASVEADLRGEPYFVADLAAAERAIETSPWVRDARVTRRFPDTVVIEVAERQPLIHYRGADGRFRVIDDQGVVLAVLDGQPVDYVPVTSGGPDVEAGGFAGGTFRAAAQVVEALPDEVRPLVASVGITEAGELTLTLTSGTEVRLGRPDDLQSKLVALVVVLRRQDPAGLTLIDVSSGEPTVR